MLSAKIYKPIFYINSILILLFFSLLILGKSRLSTTPLLILSLIFIPLVARDFKLYLTNDRYFRGVLIWSMSLFLYGSLGVTRLFIDGEIDLSSYDRWSRYILMAYVSIYLYVTGIYYKVVPIGVVIAILIAAFEAYVSPGFSGRLSLGYNPTSTGSILAAYTCLAIAFASVFDDKFFRIGLILASIVGMSLVFQTGTRGAYLALIVFGSILLFLKREKIFVPGKISLIISFSVVVIVLSMMTSLVSDRFHRTISEVSQIVDGNQNTSIGIRFQLWSIAYDLGKSSPVFGVGFDQQAALSRFENENVGVEISPQLRALPNFHNLYLDLFAKSGILMIFSLFFLLISSLTYLKDNTRTPILAVMTVLFICGFTDVVLYSGVYIMLLMVGVSALRASRLNFDSPRE